jgi:hypothetical protein
MVLKWVIWRLRTESWPPLKGRKGRSRPLVLRDRKGYFRKFARTRLKKLQLRAYYERNYSPIALEKASKAIQLKERVRRLKEKVRALGFRYQMSVWGIDHNETLGASEYRRYEVFRADQWTQDDFAKMHKRLNEHPLKSTAGVLVYHNNKLYTLENDGLIFNGKGKS